MSRFRIVFMGSPDFAVPCIEALADAHEVVAAVTQPDRPAGRGRKLTPPPVKQAAEARGIPVLQPTKVRGAQFPADLAAFGADLAVVTAYGRILTPAVLGTFPRGCWNVHASLLPRWRGAAPIQWSIIDGDAETGVTIMKMDAGLDTGDIALQKKLSIAPTDSCGDLMASLSTLGAEAILEALARLDDDNHPLTLTPQDDGAAVLAPLLSKTDGRLTWDVAARAVCCLARGVDPWPAAQARLDDDRQVKLFGPVVVDREAQRGAPGEILGLDEHGLQIACGEGVISFAEVQLPGKKRLPAKAVLAGRGLQIGQRLS